MQGLTAAYNDAMRMLLCVQRSYIATLMIVSINVTICQALIRNLAKNSVAQALVDPTKSCCMLRCGNSSAGVSLYFWEWVMLISFQCFHCDVHICETDVWNVIFLCITFSIRTCDLIDLLPRRPTKAENIRFTPNLHQRDQNTSIFLITLIQSIVLPTKGTASPYSCP